MAGLDTSIYTAANPNAFLQGAQLQNTQLAGAQAHQDLVRQQVGTLVDAFSSLAAKPDVTYDDFARVGSTLLQQGVIDPNTYQAEMANLPRQADPGSYQKIANGYLARALDAGSRFGVEYGYGAGAGAAPVNVTEPNGALTTTSQAGAAQRFGYGNPMGAPNPLTAAPAGPAAAATPSPNPLTAGAPAATPEPATTPVPLAPLPAPKGVTGPSPQQQAQFDASSKQQQADVTADADYQAAIVPIKKVLALLPEVPLFGTGSEIPSEVAKVLATYGVPQAALQSKDSSELEKYLAGIARNSGAAPNAVAQLEQSITANPNMGSDRLAAKDVLGTQLALARFQHLKVATLGNTAPEKYSDQARKWAADQDVRALALDLMDDKAKAALRKQLDADPKAAAKFVATYAAAKQAGIFDQ